MRAKTIANDLVTGLLSHKPNISPSRSDLSLDCFSKLAFFAKNLRKFLAKKANFEKQSKLKSLLEGEILGLWLNNPVTKSLAMVFARIFPPSECP